MKTINAKIIEISNPSDDYYSIKLTTEDDFTWTAGQFAKFELDDMPENQESRIFSIASTVDEGYILVGTRSRNEKISEFKKKFLNLEKGSMVKISGPMGNFCIKDETSPIILYASGVGITPVRSILNSIKNKNNRKIEIVYAADYYLYEENLLEIVENNDAMNIYFTKTIDETTNKLKELSNLYKNEAYYYTSGAPFVIKAVEDNYLDLEIEKSRLCSDNFIGY